jgi:hypothetical protein
LLFDLAPFPAGFIFFFVATVFRAGSAAATALTFVLLIGFVAMFEE